MRFVKMHGLGNDYVYLDAVSTPALARRSDLSALARAMSDRHRGIGSDGLILLCRPAGTAGRSIPGFIEAYKAVSRDTSDKERERAERRAAGSTSKPASSGSKTATTAGSQLSAMDG